MAPAVSATLSGCSADAVAVLQVVRAHVLNAVPHATESVKWNAPSYATTEHFATFHLRAKRGVQLILHLGAKARPDADMPSHVTDPAGLLQWKGADRAIAAFADLSAVERHGAALEAILGQWVAHVR
jgi:hypothetical protein